MLFGQTFLDALLDAPRRDAVVLVVGHLLLAARFRDGDHSLHGVREPLRVHDHLAMDVPGRAPRRLDQGRLRSQESLLVRVENGHERDLRQIQPLAQKVDADQAVEVRFPQAAQDFHAFDRVDLRVKVLHAQADVMKVLRQILRGLLGQRRDEGSFLAFGPLPDLLNQVVDLACQRPDLDRRVENAGRPDDLRDRLAGHILLERTRRCRREDHRARRLHELVVVHGPVVERGGQTEPVVDEHLLARTVAVVHAADLRDRDVRLVDDREELPRKIIKKRRRPFPRRASGQVPRVVLDPATVADLPEHFDIVLRAHSDPLGFQQFIILLEPFHALLELRLDGPQRSSDLVRRHDEMPGGGNDHRLHIQQRVSGQRIDAPDGLHLVAEEINADAVLGIRGKDIQRVAAHAERPRVGGVVVPRVLDIDELLQNAVALDRIPLVQAHQHFAVVLRRAQTVDARHGRHDNHVLAVHQRVGGGKTEALDLLVDGRILLDVRVRLRDVGLGLVIVVVTDEVLDGIVRKEPLQLGVQLSRQRLVVRDHQRRPAVAGDHIRHRERLAGPGHAFQGLETPPLLQPFTQRLNGLRLIAGGLVRRDKLEPGVHKPSTINHFILNPSRDLW